MANKFISRLKAGSGYFSGVEKKIADVILADPQRFTEYSMAELAEAADVSQGSIINFAKKFAGGGFPALKQQVGEVPENEEQPFSIVGSEDSVKDVLAKTINESYNAFKNTLAINDEAVLKSAADKILKAKKVEIYGIYRSAVVATYFYYQLLNIGIPAGFVSDMLTCTVSASMLRPDSLVIAVSESGKTRDIIDAVKAAKANGVPAICITANPDSPLARLSDDVLVAAPGGNSISGSPTEIRLSQLVIADSLCSYLRDRVDENSERRYFEISKILNSHDVND